jgi:hypothetical protein
MLKPILSFYLEGDVNILMKNELKSLNNDIISRIREGKCGDVNIHEMLKAVSVLDATSAGQNYLLDHRSEENFDELLEMLNAITVDMRDGKMNVSDLTIKYNEKIPQVEEISQAE